MSENASLSGSIDQIDLDFVEREATPRLLMKLSIQLHLAGLSRCTSLKNKGMKKKAKTATAPKPTSAQV